MNAAPEVSPLDEYNKTLARNAHPSDWTNPRPAERYNLVVIGAGTAGLVTAAGAAGLGGKVALVEKHLLGGDCLNVGCVPSKCIIRSARLAADIRGALEFGITVAGGVEVDFAAVMERMRKLRARISFHDSAKRFADMGIDIFFGRGCFSGPGTIDVDGDKLRFARAVIATGARAVRPDVAGLEEAGFLTNETVFSLTERPARLAVFGAGPLGCELAQAFARLGSEVTIVEKRGKLLPREDPDATAILGGSFERDGIGILYDAAVEAVEKTPSGKLLRMKVDGRDETLEVDEILVGAGRAPNVEGLGLDTVGVEYDARSGVHVTDTLRTTNRRIYAAGDVCLSAKFTHTADAAARIVLQNALFWGRKRFSSLVIPWCTYTDPEIAHVGMYEKDAEAAGIEIDTFVKPLDDVDRAIADGETRGFVKVHVKKGTDRIVGATVVARHAGEMISELSVAIAGGVGLGALGNVIHPYPTQAEAIKQAGDAYNRTRLTPLLKKVFAKILKMRR